MQRIFFFLPQIIKKNGRGAGMKTLSDKDKKALIKQCTPKSKTVKNTAKAFVTGGSICLVAELLKRLYIYIGANDEMGSLYATLSIVLIGGVLTAIGIFDRFARHGGAGTLVPITGFSNSVVASAIDSASEGYVLGVGKGIFTVAGPVLLYATVSGVVYGLIYFIFTSL